jgi:hypothetical protein
MNLLNIVVECGKLPYMYTAEFNILKRSLHGLFKILSMTAIGYRAFK